MSTTLVEPAIVPVVIPYFKECVNLPGDILNRIYKKLVKEDLDRVLMHNRAVSEEEFVQFARNEALTSIFLDQANGRYVGLAWLANIEECETLSKGIGSFCFFREYWHPEITQPFADIFLSHAFNVIGLSLVYGITPAPNRMAMRFCKRLGFQYTKEPIPNFVTFGGNTVDAFVCTLDRESFNQRIAESGDLKNG